MGEEIGDADVGAVVGVDERREYNTIVCLDRKSTVVIEDLDQRDRGI